MYTFSYISNLESHIWGRKGQGKVLTLTSNV